MQCGTTKQECRYPASRNCGFIAQEYSALPGDVSAVVSNETVQPIVQLTDGDLFTIDRVVRKLAHVAEYLVLGLCLMVNVLDLRKSRKG